MEKGKLIVIEGTDCSGKETQKMEKGGSSLLGLGRRRITTNKNSSESKGSEELFLYVGGNEKSIEEHGNGVQENDVVPLRRFILGKCERFFINDPARFFHELF